LEDIEITEIVQGRGPALVILFAGKRKRFEIALAPEGTPFQREVWKAISSVAFGKTISYGELARRLSSGPRAVGQACGTNYFPLLIPCHRVVAAKGLGGFAHTSSGYLLEVKRRLLLHEQREKGAAWALRPASAVFSDACLE